MTQDWPTRWDLLLRYRLIEIVAMWEGRLTTNHLRETFGIGRQQASKDINNYLSDIAPGNLEYDKHIKGYKPSPTFKPALTSGTADEYLQLMHRNKDLKATFQELEIQSTPTEIIQAPLRNVTPRVLRPIVQAAREQHRLDVDYVSLSQKSSEGRVIVPHTLVFTGIRWHVRAYCEKNRDFRDFVLSRFRGTPEPMGLSDIGMEQDERWNRIITVRIKPDPRLEPHQRKIIAHDYGMKSGVLLIKTRAALTQYTLQQLQIDPDILKGKPGKQQIIIDNLSEIETYLFR